MVGVWDSSSHNLYLYLNGALVATQNTGTYVPSVSSGGTLTLGSDYNPGGGSAVGFTAGTIDDVHVYARALGAADVAALFGTSVCISPLATAAGQIVYNATSSVMQYCHPLRGWVAMGPTPGAGGGGCSSPSGAAGNMFYNIDKAVIQYCDGTNWIGMGENVTDERAGRVLEDGRGHRHHHGGLIGEWQYRNLDEQSDMDNEWQGWQCADVQQY